MQRSRKKLRDGAVVVVIEVGQFLAGRGSDDQIANGADCAQNKENGDQHEDLLVEHPFHVRTFDGCGGGVAHQFRFVAGEDNDAVDPRGIPENGPTK